MVKDVRGGYYVGHKPLLVAEISGAVETRLNQLDSYQSAVVINQSA